MRSRTVVISTLLLVPVLALCGCGANPEPATIEPEEGARVVVVHEVADFDEWHTRFAEQVTSRLDMGIEEELILQGESMSNLVFLLMSARDSVSAADWLQSPATARSMEFSGVKGELLTDILAPGIVYPDTPEYETRLVVRHPVSDFDRWYSTFRGHERERLDVGVHTMLVTHPLGDPNDVYMMFGVSDPERVAEYMASDLLGLAMRLAGVTAQPQAFFVNVVE